MREEAITEAEWVYAIGLLTLVKELLIDAFPQQSPGIAPDGKSEPKPYRLLRYRYGLTPAL